MSLSCSSLSLYFLLVCVCVLCSESPVGFRTGSVSLWPRSRMALEPLPASSWPNHCTCSTWSARSASTPSSDTPPPSSTETSPGMCVCENPVTSSDHLVDVPDCPLIHNDSCSTHKSVLNLNIHDLRSLSCACTHRIIV